MRGSPSDVSIYSMEVRDGAAHLRLSTRTLALERLAERFLGLGPDDLTSDETDYLDAIGNGDGQYDLGDLRAYLREHPSVAALRTGSWGVTMSGRGRVGWATTVAFCLAGIGACSNTGTGPDLEADSWLAFVSRRDGNDDVFVADRLGSRRNINTVTRRRSHTGVVS